MAKISQREARRLRKRVHELEQQEFTRNRSWSSEYPGGVHLDTITVRVEEWWTVKTAVALGHAVVVKPDSDKKLRVYGMRKQS